MLSGKPSPQPPKGPTKAKESPKPKQDSKINVFEDYSDSDSNTSTDSNMSLDYGSDNEDSHDKVKKEDTKQDVPDQNKNKDAQDKHSTGQQPKKNVKQEKRTDSSNVGGKESKNYVLGVEEKNIDRGKYQFRRSIAKGSYAEPSLRVKMRRGDSHPNIIPEYVGMLYILSHLCFIV